MILAGGAVAFVVGVFLLILCFNQFLTVLLGLIPVILLVGGAFAAYSGYDEWKEKRKGESEEFEPTFETTRWRSRRSQGPQGLPESVAPRKRRLNRHCPVSPAKRDSIGGKHPTGVKQLWRSLYR
jgi:hypothetical protein